MGNALARRRILDAAGELFARHGFDATTVSDVCARANVNRTTFYRHFPEKPTLLGSLLPDRLATLFRVFADSVGESGPHMERAIAAVGPVLRALEDDGLICALLREAAFSSEKDRIAQSLRDVIDTIEAVAAALLRRAHESGEAVCLDPEATVSLVVSIAIGWCVQPPALRTVSVDRFANAVGEVLRHANMAAQEDERRHHPLVAVG